MTLYDAYMDTDYLEDVSFIAGTEYTFLFKIANETGTLQNINGSTLEWALSLYGQPETMIIYLSGSSTQISGYDANTFSVVLNESDTIGLGDVYLQQVIFTDSSGKKFRPAQGIVVIRKAIPIT